MNARQPFLALAILSLLGPMAFADRTVTAVPKEAKIKISNPSNLSMNYDVVCRDATGTILLNSMGNFLPINQSTEHAISGGGSACRAPFSQDTTFSAGMVMCTDFSFMNPKNYMQANDSFTGICGSGYHLCTIPEYKIALPPAAGAPLAWLGRGTSPNFYSSMTNGATWTFESGMMKPVTSWNSGDQCSHVGTPAISDTNYCYSQMETNSFYRGMCCPDTGGASQFSGFCKITVHGNNGHLVTPDFKGGTPF